MAEGPTGSRIEHGLRLGCGGLLGFVFGAVLAFWLLQRIFWIPGLVFLVIVSGLSGAYFAEKFGKGFWRFVVEVLTLPWP